jgi:hypothetical protein
MNLSEGPEPEDIQKKNGPVRSFFNDSFTCLMIPAALFGIVFCALAALTLQSIRTDQLRCYVLDEPFTVGEQALMNDPVYACAIEICRVTLKLNSSLGMSCFMPLLIPSESAMRPPVAQISGDHLWSHRW